jgi:RNA polymerase sigma-70 factor (ECF subfamily)
LDVGGAGTSTARARGSGDAGADAALLRRLGGGDSDALGELYDRYSMRAFALALRMTADRSLAEDVVQEMFLALWRKPGMYDPARGAFSGWLLAAVHHKSVDVVRREVRERRRPAVSGEATAWYGDEPVAPVQVDELAWAGVKGQHVRTALRALPDPQREAIVLAYYGGYTQREIATLTGAPLGTVKTRTLAGMRRLRGLLDGLAEAGGEPV